MAMHHITLNSTIVKSYCQKVLAEYAMTARKDLLVLYMAGTIKRQRLLRAMLVIPHLFILRLRGNHRKNIHIWVWGLYIYIYSAC